MKKLLTILFLCLSLSAFSQSKKAKKLHQSYEAGNFDKAEKLSNKMLSKDSKDVDALYIQGLILLKEARAEKSNGRINRDLKKAISIRDKISLDASFYRQLNDSIQLFIYSRLAYQDLKSVEKQKYLSLLAKDFGDTLAEYKNNYSYTSEAIPNERAWPQDSIRRVLLQFAQELEGIPYKWAGESPKTGFDCSGFTQYVYKSVGIELPHNAQMQSELIKDQKSLDEAVPGDLIFFGSGNNRSFNTQHAGIVYSRNGENIEVIHCVSNGVNIDGQNSSWDQYWSDKVLFVIDLLSLNEIKE